MVVVGVWDRDFALSDVEGWFGVFRKESRKASYVVWGKIHHFYVHVS